MKIQEINLYRSLQEQSLSESVLKNILSTPYFKMLLDANVVLRVKSGRGAIYQVINPSAFSQFLKNHYTPIEENHDLPDKIIHAVSINNSKYQYKGEQIIFIRGFKTMLINDVEVDLNFHTEQFGVFSTSLISLVVERLCYIENLKCFLMAEKLLGKDYIYFHPYGRPSRALLQKMDVKELLFFPDYDYTGLNDYLRCKTAVPQTKLYLPFNYKQSIKLLAKKPLPEQNIPNEVLECTEEAVQYIVHLLQTTHLFLEQEKLFYER